MGHRGRSRQWAGGPDGPWKQNSGSGRRGHGWGGPGGPFGGPGGGAPPWVAGLFGLGQAERTRGPRVRRGDVRSAILDVLATAAREEEALNGYQVIQQIAERSEGAWRPSPGSVYPTIQQLQDEGLVESDDARGRRTVRLSATGLSYAEEHADELATVWAPFARTAAGPDGRPDGGPGGADAEQPDLKTELGQVMPAVWQIITSGSPTQRQAALEILADTRRRLYGVLADGPDADGLDELDELDEGDER